MLNIVSRGMWQAKEPRAETAPQPPFQHVYLMNAPRDYCYTRAQCLTNIHRMQEFHMSVQNQRDIRFNFLVGGDGSVYEGRGWNAVPMLPIRYSDYQDNSMIIGYIGEFSADTLPPIMSKAGQDLMSYGVQQGYVSQNYEKHDIMKKPSFHRKEFSGDPNYDDHNDRYNRYDRNDSYGRNDSYNRNDRYDRGRSYDRNASYGRNDSNNRDDSYGGNDSYNRSASYGRNDSYNRNASFGRNDSYNRDDSYGRNDSYNRNDGYDRNDSYESYDRNDSYERDPE